MNAKKNGTHDSHISSLKLLRSLPSISSSSSFTQPPPPLSKAKIYYTLSIQEGQWLNAYYMAPITGAVLSKIFDYILDYPTHHPRYQPFTVVAKNRPDTPVLLSSNSDDFVWNVFTKLTSWYVDIEPVLSPNRYGIRLYVEDDVRDVERLGGNG